MFAGPRAKIDRRWLWFSLPASALAVGVLFQVVDVAANQLRFGNSVVPVVVPAAGRARPTRTSTRIDENGKLLTNVLLYDEDGQPINAPRQYNSCRSGDEEPMIPANRYPTSEDRLRKRRLLHSGTECARSVNTSERAEFQCATEFQWRTFQLGATHFCVTQQVMSGSGTRRGSRSYFFSCGSAKCRNIGMAERRSSLSSGESSDILSLNSSASP